MTELNPIIDDFDVPVIPRKDPWKPEILFVCLLCGEAVEKLKPWYSNSYMRMPPVCSSCCRNWGMKVSGPVFNRKNFQSLRQLSATINLLEWNIKNGRRYGFRRG